MVSSGTVNSDASSFNGCLNEYKSSISGLDGVWKGQSYDNFISQAETFLSEYGDIVKQMNSFAVACDEYEKYVKTKSNISQIEASREAASDSQKSSYDSTLDQLRSNLSLYKSNIESYLNEASSPKLSAVSISTGKTSSLGTDMASLESQGLIVSEKSGYVFPFAQGVSAPVTSSLGPRDQPTAGASTNHQGTDIGVPEGTELHALGDGVVTNAGRDDAGGFGNWVRLELDDGTSVIYGHVSDSTFYNVGDRVNAGDVVALSGNEGMSTGPHLHLQIEDSSGNILNSEYLFEDCWPS